MNTFNTGKNIGELKVNPGRIVTDNKQIQTGLVLSIDSDENLEVEYLNGEKKGTHGIWQGDYQVVPNINGLDVFLEKEK